MNRMQRHILLLYIVVYSDSEGGWRAYVGICVQVCELDDGCVRECEEGCVRECKRRVCSRM